MPERNINHYEICCFLYAGNIAEAKRSFIEKMKGQTFSPSMRYVCLSSLNFSIYNFILIQEQVSLYECCLENETRIARASSDALLETGLAIISAYGMDSRYLIAKYENPHIQNAVAYIHRHLNGELSLQSVSQMVHISKNYFCELFKKEVGISFGAYVRTQRVKLARQLLSGTELSLQDIAERCGFQTASYFSTCFKKSFGYSPSELKRQH